MRYFLIFLFGCFSFFASAQVVIPPAVARYFLEQDDRVKILIQKDSINQLLVGNLSQQIEIKNKIITIYKGDSVIFKNIITTKDEEIAVVTKGLQLAQLKANVKDFQICLFTGTTVGSLIGSAIPGVGTFSGAFIGGVSGSLVYVVKQLKKFFKQ